MRKRKLREQLWAAYHVGGILRYEDCDSDQLRRDGDTKHGFKFHGSDTHADYRTLGWRTGCECGAESVPCRVIDPYSGMATTGLVSTRMGRDYTGVELNPAYAAQSRRRLAASMPLYAEGE